jgi:HK97 gp10 family phage protein
MTFKTKGFAELSAKLGMIPTELTRRNVAIRSLTKSAEPMKDKIQQLAPRDTGLLKSAIVISNKANFGRKSKQSRQQFGDIVEVFIGIDQSAGTEKDGVARYSTIVEEGSNDTPAKPYFRPGFQSEGMATIDRIKDSLSLEISNAIKRLKK